MVMAIDWSFNGGIERISDYPHYLPPRLRVGPLVAVFTFVRHSPKITDAPPDE